MTKFITQISKEDFIRLHPNVLPIEYVNGESSLFPVALAIHKNYPDEFGYFGKYIGYDVKVFIADQVKHIYSTRDYWSIERVDEPGFRYNLPKDETKSIYLIFA
jgi:hypothetical protein